MPPGQASPVARFAWILGLVTFGVCVVIGFGVGFVAGQSEPKKRAEKPAPEVAKLTKKETSLSSPKSAVTIPTAAKPVATAPTKAEPSKTVPTSMKGPESPPTKPEKRPEPKPEPKKPDPKTDAPTFAKVSAVFKDKCVLCHGAVGSPKGGLDLRTLAAVNKGGDSGPAVKPGDLAGSPLWDSIESGQMPPPKKEPLTTEEKKLIREWILGGAKP